MPLRLVAAVLNANYLSSPPFLAISAERERFSPRRHLTTLPRKILLNHDYYAYDDDESC